MKRSVVSNALDGLFAKVRAAALGVVLVASFAAPGVASVAQSSSFTAHTTTLSGVAMVHRNPECGGGGIPCD